MCIDADKYNFFFLNPSRSVPDRIKASNELSLLNSKTKKRLYDSWIRECITFKERSPQHTYHLKSIYFYLTELTNSDILSSERLV